jgi:hypothetical protein
MDGICPSPCVFLLHPRPRSGGPDLFLQLMVVVALPLDLLCSPGLGKICKFSQVVDFEPSPTEPIARFWTPLFLLSFDNEN